MGRNRVPDPPANTRAFTRVNLDTRTGNTRARGHVRPALRQTAMITRLGHMRPRCKPFLSTASLDILQPRNTSHQDRGGGPWRLSSKRIPSRYKKEVFD